MVLTFAMLLERMDDCAAAEASADCAIFEVADKPIEFSALVPSPPCADLPQSFA